MELAAGSWAILCRREHLELARAFLGPLPPESFLHAVRRAGRGRSQREAEPSRRPAGEAASAAPARGGTLGLACGDGRRVLVKALFRGGLPARLGGGFHGRRRLLAEMAALEEAGRRGVPTARLAFGASGVMKSGRVLPILATEEIEGALSLAGILASPSTDRDAPGDRRRALEAAGAAVRRAHDLGLDHPDLNIGNVLMTRAGAPRGGEPAGEEPMGSRVGEEALAYLIDLGPSRLGPALQPARRGANLVRLYRSAEKHLGEDPRRLRDAAAFLRGYLRAAPDPGRRLRRQLLGSVRRRLPAVALHRLRWRISGYRPGGRRPAR